MMPSNTNAKEGTTKGTEAWETTKLPEEASRTGGPTPDRKDDDPPPNDDAPQRSSAPLIRRITTVAPKDGA